MKKFILPLLLVSSFAWAVEEQPQDATAATQETATDTPATAELSVDTTQAPQIQAIQNTQKFDEWAVSCFYEPTGEASTTQGILRNCQTAHIFQTADQKQLMRMYMVYEQDADKIAERPSLLFHVPAGVFLAPQITLQVDTNNTVTIPYNFCDQGGCYGGGFITDSLIDQFKKGGKTKVEFYDNRRQPITLDFSLKGFTNASDYLGEQAQNIGKTIDIPQTQQN